MTIAEYFKVTSDTIAIVSAVGAAAIAVFTKVLSDYLVRHADRRSVAAAVAGEMAGYLDTLKPRRTAEYLRIFVHAARADRIAALKALPPLPKGHPVYDRISEKTGLLQPRLTREITRFYNVVSGFRGIYGHLSTENFLEANDDIQCNALRLLASGIEEYLVPAYWIVRRLEAASYGRLHWRTLLGCWWALILHCPPKFRKFMFRTRHSRRSKRIAVRLK